MSFSHHSSLLSPKTLPRSSPFGKSFSSVSDSNLIDREARLSADEQLYLQELARFYADVEQFERRKRELQQSSGNIADRTRILEKLATNLYEFEQVLIDREEKAKKRISDQAARKDKENKDIIDKETEIKSLEQQIPQESFHEEQESHEIEELQKIRYQNESKSKLLKQKQQNIINKQKELDQELIKLKEIEYQEEGINKGARDLLNTILTNLLDEEQYNKLLKEKEDLEDKLLEANARIQNADAKQKQFTREQKVRLMELNSLQTELDNVNQSSQSLKELTSRLDQSFQQNTDFESQIQDLDGQIARLKRKLEIQNAEIQRMEAQEKDLEKRRAACESNNKSLDEIENQLKKRKQQVEIQKSCFPTLNKELDDLKKKYEEKEKSCTKLEKTTQDILHQFDQIQKQIYSYASSTQSEHQQAFEGLSDVLSSN
ncbi:hypothetical protein TVAG_414840 [Trichomonas vaginalis G3]|uniref:Uncharacterized protein n=1 Tax=Trichomonas vaginalis (strain ATCC PRA-98 / G3) TaxID=412133 RepID=A2G2P4_TRIV3|nr:tropomyosin family [Trichomonas vaginalis G3]EAX88567.1 hypothetical protein TVAG_414840 [Trichomonas vaginalis G3]KAI5535328.1 tropomyosin family [Trichomonas vaginalis G3]|eukprot:XP_001301497.1 hypothetical protein [Trichomonas vaginalis G3]